MPARTSPTRTASVLTACLVLLTVAGCAGPGGEAPAPGGEAPGDHGTASEAPGAPDAGSGLSSCVEGTWAADLDDLARQLGDTLAGNGMNIVESGADGTQEVAVGGDGVIDFSSDATLRVTVDMGDGLEMTISQQHLGTTHADWTWHDSAASDSDATMRFENVDSSHYAIHNTTEVGGRVSETEIPVSAVGFGEVPLLVTCTGDTMTTTAEVSPFTTTWHRA